MPGRTVLDTMGMCVTNTCYYEVPDNKWVLSPALYSGGGGSAEALDGTTIDAGTDAAYAA